MFVRFSKLSYGSVKAYIILDLHISTQELDMPRYAPEFPIKCPPPISIYNSAPILNIISILPQKKPNIDLRFLISYIIAYKTRYRQLLASTPSPKSCTRCLFHSLMNQIRKQYSYPPTPLFVAMCLTDLPLISKTKKSKFKSLHCLFFVVCLLNKERAWTL